MSFVEQERALFDLLFDSSVRERFCHDFRTALKDYDLEEHELEDFSKVRTDALIVDANIRTSLVLSQLCRSYPMTFSLVSSLVDGMQMLRRLVDLQTMRTSNIDRATIFGKRISEEMPLCSFASDREEQLIIAIFQLEMGMAWTSASLKQTLLESGGRAEANKDIPQDWLVRPVGLAAFVSAGIIPCAYEKLKTGLCPVPDNELWRYLGHSPTTSSRVSLLLAKEDPRLLVTRAQVEHMSLCEPTVNHQTSELSEGFAPLFQHINGSVSIETLLSHLKQAGADETIIEGVKSAFLQLLKNGMLEIL